MTNLQCLGLGFALFAGFVAHGLLSRTCPSATAAASMPDAKTIELEKLRIRSMETLALIHRGAPTVVHLGNRPLIVDTVWKQQDGDLKITTRYYEWKDDGLVKVSLVEADK